ncbi:hypothetical protein IJH72_00070 [Candidatus Saccharibacteria bacterium]|nr:hypothetical protein [Candidatus Saccharibacteria bacterium]
MSQNTFAVDTDVMMKKWEFTQFYQCVRDGNLNSSVDLEQNDKTLISELVFKKAGRIFLPSYNFRHTATGYINCYNLYMGSAGLSKGLSDYAGMNKNLTNEKNPEQASNTLIDLGYTLSKTGSWYMKFTTTSIMRDSSGPIGAGNEVGTMLVNVDDKGSGKLEYSTDGYNGAGTIFDHLSVKISGSVGSQKMTIAVNPVASAGCQKRSDRGEQSVTISLNGSDVQATENAINDGLRGKNWSMICSMPGDGSNIYYRDYNFSDDSVVVAPKGVYTYPTANQYSVVSSATSKMSGMTLSGLGFSNSEFYILYKYYLEKSTANVGGKIDCESTSAPTTNSLAVKLKYNDEFKTCYANYNTNNPSSIPVVYTQKIRSNGSYSYPVIESISISEIVNWLNNVDESTLTDIDNITDGGSGETSEGEVTCMSAGGAKALGWIICPILDFLAGSSQEIYSDYVGPALQVNSSILFSGEDEGGHSNVRQAWGTFRDIGNIAFIVLLLVVIFSQLTGVGIDNYGIKKILPKLIVSAILINLSYLICVLLVDLSNVVGVSFQGLFNSLPPADGEVSVSFKEYSGSVGLSGFISVALIGSIVLGGAAIFTNPAILLTVFVSAISIIISMLFLFVLLSVREAAVIVLIVASPLAVICYMLPNMKKMFDRWWKLFYGMLLVYPVSSLLVGGGNYISKLLLSTSASGGFFEMFTAMIVGVAPIFFIPTVLKGSFSAMGKIGGTLAGLGKTVSSGASKRMRDSEGYKNLQTRGVERRTRLRAGINSDGEAKELGRIGLALRGGRRSVARNRMQYLKDQDTKYRAENLTAGAGMAAALLAQEKGVDAERINNWEKVVDHETRNGSDYDSLSNLYDEYSASGNVDGMRAVARVAGRRKDYAARFMKDKFKDENAESKYGRAAMSSVAKEMATGSSSGTYRAATPLGYGFISQINENPENANYTYSDGNGGGWRNSENVSNTMKAFVTNPSELMAMKGSEINEIADAIRDGQIDHEQANRLRELASVVYEKRNEPNSPWDTTKEGNVLKLMRAGQPTSQLNIRSSGGQTYNT